MLHYETNGRPAFYAINFQSSFSGEPEVAQNFNIRCSGMTRSMRWGYNPLRYTVLESHISAARVNLSSKLFPWAYSICTRLLTHHKIPLLRKNHQGPSILMTSLPTQRIYDLEEGHVSKLFLGGTFWLLEVCCWNQTAYILESERHCRSFRFSDFQRWLQGLVALDHQDWEDALVAFLFPVDANFPVHVPSEVDFRVGNPAMRSPPRYSLGGSYYNAPLPLRSPQNEFRAWNLGDTTPSFSEIFAQANENADLASQITPERSKEFQNVVGDTRN